MKNDWARGHYRRGATMTPIPGPDDPVYETIDVGELVPDDTDLPESPAPGVPRPAAPPINEAGPVPPADDAPPAHGRRDWQRGPRQAKGKPPRITATIRGDIDAKISFALEIPGRVWQARDPVCGGTFIAQRPEISSALTEIVCQSADLVAWFTGSGGQFMLWLNLAAACWPVLTVVQAHHVFHSIEDGEQPQPDMSRYAA